MDDGGKNGSGYKISTESFSYYEVCLLQNAVLKNFHLQSSIQKYKHQFVLYFAKKHTDLFSSIVKPNMYSCMYYKLH